MNKSGITKMQTVIIVAIIVIATIIGAVGYYYLTQKPEKEYIVVGASLTLSGGLAFHGENQKAAFEFAIEDINAEGGVYVKDLGRKLPIKFIYYDDGTDPTKAKSNAEKLISVDGADFLVGDWGTPQCFATATVAEENHVVYIPVGTASFVYEKNNYDWTFIPFHTEISNKEGIFKLLSELPSDIRPSRLAIWEEDTVLGADNAAGVLHWVEHYSPLFTVVYHEKYTPGQTDYSSLILKTKEADAEVVFGVPTTTDAVTLIKQSRELGFFPKLFWFDRAAEPTEYWDLLGEDAAGCGAGLSGHPLVPIPKNLEITERYRQKYGKEPAAGLSCSYAIFQVLVAAIEKAGTLNGETVRETLCTLEVDTVIGRIKFNGPGHAELDVTVFQWQNGKQEVIYPPQFATAEFLYPRPVGP